MDRGALRKVLGVAATGAGEPVLVRARDAAQFQREFATAVAGEGNVFLGDPAWGDGELARAKAIMAQADAPKHDRGWLMIPTGGTSGGLKFARHDGYSIAAAVRGFAQHFGIERVNALGVLPLYHVSGLMAWMRSVMTGGAYHAWDWKQLEAGAWPALDEGAWVTSLVPTQLERLLRQPAAVERLRAFRVVLLGGAAPWPELLNRAAEARVPLALSYGMTETAAMVTAVRPEEFLAGDRSAGRALPHARLWRDADGVVQVSGSSLFRGYFPDWRHERTYFATADLGDVDAAGRWTLLGRRDAAIISGGEKVHPALVEDALRAATGAPELAVVGLPDAEWGERVVCVFPAAAPFDVARAQAAAGGLAPAARPKAFLALGEWPRNEAGKLNRARLRDLAARVVSGR
jgi:O-succinylbenzoic acid--CoA ligase